MKFKRILDTPSLQGFQIISPSKEFKKKYPKKFTFVVSFGDNNVALNTPSLPFVLALPMVRGYIFTYNSKLPAFTGSLSYKEEFIDNSTYPECLDQYFPRVDSDKNIDIIFKASPKHNHEVPPCLSDNLIIRSYSLSLLGKDSYEDALKTSENGEKTLKKHLLDIIYKHLTYFDTPEKWFDNIIDRCPLDSEGCPIRYIKDIDSSTLRAKPKADDFFITYDFRPTYWAKSKDIDYEYENLLETTIENAFESPSLELEIYNNYNDIVPRMKEALDKQKISYVFKKEQNKILITLKNLRKLNMTYDMTDFL